MNIAARVSLAATDWDTGGGKLETIFDPINVLYAPSSRFSRRYAVASLLRDMAQYASF